MNIKNKFLFTKSKLFQGSENRDKARNFLVIPKTKKLLLVFSDSMTAEDVILLCKSIKDGQQNNYYVFVISSRNSDIPSVINNEFGEDPAIKSVVVSKKIGIFLQAADATVSYGKEMYEQITETTRNVTCTLSDSIQEIIRKIKPKKRGAKA